MARRGRSSEWDLAGPVSALAAPAVRVDRVGVDGAEAGREVRAFAGPATGPTRPGVGGGSKLPGGEGSRSSLESPAQMGVVEGLPDLSGGRGLVWLLSAGLVQLLRLGETLKAALLVPAFGFAARRYKQRMQCHAVDGPLP